MPKYEIEVFPVGVFQCNCSIVMNAETKKAWVVDPGDEAHVILERLQYHDLKVEALWHTHAHLDHIGATKKVWEQCTAWNKEKQLAAPQIYLHPEDTWLYNNVAIQSQMLGLPSFEVPKNIVAIKSQQKYSNFEAFTALHTPGHTPGSCCLNISAECDLWLPQSFGVGKDDGLSNVLLSGDTLFKRSIGRTDLWGGDSQLILKSIREKIFTLNPETVVIPGHGPLTRVEEEIERNPFLR
jgi:glyoxylase-like metal-dependent hydrolase (beta-lactamase superfamily II)